MNENDSGTVTDPRGFDMVALLLSLWKGRLVILFTMLSVMVGSLAVTLMLNKVYVSRGFFSLSLSLVEHKRLLERVTTAGTWLPEHGDGLGGRLDRDQIRRAQPMLMNLMEESQSNIEPVYALTMEEIKKMGASGTKGVANALMGVKLSARGDTPELARAQVFFLGELMRDQLMLGVMVDHISNMKKLYSSSQNSSRKEEVEKVFSLGQLRKKLLFIRTLIDKYPKEDVQDWGQVATAPQGEHRFLPPSVQAVGIEAEIADLEQSIQVVQRKHRQEDLFAAFYEDVSRGLYEEKSGQVLFDKFSQAIDRVGSNGESDEELVSLVTKTLVLEKQKFESVFYHANRFLTEPSLPSKASGPDRIVVIAGTTVLSFILLLAFFILREWLIAIGVWSRGKPVNT